MRSIRFLLLTSAAEKYRAWSSPYRALFCLSAVRPAASHSVCSATMLPALRLLCACPLMFSACALHVLCLCLSVLGVCFLPLMCSCMCSACVPVVCFARAPCGRVAFVLGASVAAAFHAPRARRADRAPSARPFCPSHFVGSAPPKFPVLLVGTAGWGGETHADALFACVGPTRESKL